MAQNGIIGWKLRNGDSYKDLLIDTARDDGGKLLTIAIEELTDAGDLSDRQSILIDVEALPDLITLLQSINRGDTQ